MLKIHSIPSLYLSLLCWSHNFHCFQTLVKAIHLTSNSSVFYQQMCTIILWLQFLTVTSKSPSSAGQSSITFVSSACPSVNHWVSPTLSMLVASMYLHWNTNYTKYKHGLITSPNIYHLVVEWLADFRWRAAERNWDRLQATYLFWRKEVGKAISIHKSRSLMP